MLVGGLVVSYPKSSSNHNYCNITPHRDKVVSYPKSSSNHNALASCSPRIGVVSYPKSSSNHNTAVSRMFMRGVVSYPKSSSNHNPIGSFSLFNRLYLILNHHQTTTDVFGVGATAGCILS